MLSYFILWYSELWYAQSFWIKPFHLNSVFIIDSKYTWNILWSFSNLSIVYSSSSNIKIKMNTDDLKACLLSYNIRNWYVVLLFMKSVSSHLVKKFFFWFWPQGLHNKKYESVHSSVHPSIKTCSDRHNILYVILHSGKVCQF